MSDIETEIEEATKKVFAMTSQDAALALNTMPWGTAGEVFDALSGPLNLAPLKDGSAIVESSGLYFKIQGDLDLIA